MAISFRNLRNSFCSPITKFEPSQSSLVSIQRESYNEFLYGNKSSGKGGRASIGNVFRTIFPIEDAFGNARVEFVNYRLGEQQFTVEECREKSLTYAANLFVTVALVLFSVDQETGVSEVKSIKEQEVPLCQIPLMTENATFVINGFERVIVSQIHRSPGVFFTKDMVENVPAYAASIIPYRGSWLSMLFDSKSALNFRIDKKKKMPIYYLLRALGMSIKDIMHYYYSKMCVVFDKQLDLWRLDLNCDGMIGRNIPFDIRNKDGGIICPKDAMITRKIARDLKSSGNCYCCSKDIVGMVLIEPVEFDGSTLYDVASVVSDSMLEEILKNDMMEISVLDSTLKSYCSPIVNTVLAHKDIDEVGVFSAIAKILYPGEPFNFEIIQEKFNKIFFSFATYDLFAVGRYKINTMLGIDVPEDVTILRPEDIFLTVKKLLELREGGELTDDIDDLRNRRIRSVGESFENQVRIGLSRVARSVKEKLHSSNLDQLVPENLINGNVLSRVLKEFVMGSPLSQFMDQTNPLAELSHKRRISSLGAGGLTRERAGLEVRDVHPTHYGRICPIETPEGQNIGLISSLSTYSIVNKYGFIESPYRRVKDGVIQDEVVYLDATSETNSCICQFDSSIVDTNKICKDIVSARKNGEFVLVRSSEVDYIDVSPRQTISIATSLIPFLENTDAKRSSMGSNMQKQAVPLLSTEAPLIGTGMEAISAMDSGAVVLAKKAGVVDFVDAQKISIRVFDENGDLSSEVDSYVLRKFQRSNNSTCINQVPVVKVGQEVKVRDVIADGPATDGGEIALGRNLLVAIMPWNGYNFEDSIVISERVVREDEYVSIHIQEFEVVIRDTRLGVEEITRDIPSVSAENIAYLDEGGIVHLGTYVKPNDLLVGKLTPKSESPITPEERLLRAIFGEKVAEVRDSSLRVPPGVHGTVVGVSILTKRGLDRCARAQYILQEQVAKLKVDYEREVGTMKRFFADALFPILLDKEVFTSKKSAKKKLSKRELDEMSNSEILHLKPCDPDLVKKVATIKAQFEQVSEKMEDNYKNQIKKAVDGDDLPPGVLQVVRIYIAVKSKLQPGDKMAGRHGNKGVVSKVLPVEDMPYMEDGTPVDIVLNPLGVPSRMNIGQILEANLGWVSHMAGKKLNDMIVQNKTDQDVKKFLCDVITDESVRRIIKDADSDDLKDVARMCKKGIPFATPAFEAIKVQGIEDMLKKVDADPSGQVKLLDGLTGEAFDRKVTVGYMYILKLHHLVDDKIHARSTGTYSLVTQQPLGGKAHFGGQRFGEMECWTLEAYGAAYNLREMLTVKSDDVQGRNNIYEAIVKNETKYSSHIPESFNVLFKELLALGFNVRLNSHDDDSA